MKRKPTSKDDDTMRSEYDFSNAVRGKYYQRYIQGTNIVVLEPDIAAAFPNSEAVNDALRSLLRVAQRTNLTRRSTGRAKAARRSERSGT
jgi:hypothetical protein